MTRSPAWASRVITADESWMYVYYPSRKQQGATWLEAGEPRHPKVRCELSMKKLMLVAFWDSKGIVHREFVPQGRAVNSKMYLAIFHQMRESVRRHRPDLWRNHRHQFWLQYDGAGPHRALIVTQFCKQTNTKLVPHPPYSPDLEPSDFFLFASSRKS